MNRLVIAVLRLLLSFCLYVEVKIKIFIRFFVELEKLYRALIANTTRIPKRGLVLLYVLQKLRKSTFIDLASRSIISLIIVFSWNEGDGDYQFNDARCVLNNGNDLIAVLGSTKEKKNKRFLVILHR